MPRLQQRTCPQDPWQEVLKSMKKRGKLLNQQETAWKSSLQRVPDHRGAITYDKLKRIYRFRTIFTQRTYRVVQEWRESEKKNGSHSTDIDLTVSSHAADANLGETDAERGSVGFLPISWLLQWIPGSQLALRSLTAATPLLVFPPLVGEDDVEILVPSPLKFSSFLEKSLGEIIFSWDNASEDFFFPIPRSCAVAASAVASLRFY